MDHQSRLQHSSVLREQGEARNAIAATVFRALHEKGSSRPKHDALTQFASEVKEAIACPLWSQVQRQLDNSRRCLCKRGTEGDASEALAKAEEFAALFFGLLDLELSVQVTGVEEDAGALTIGLLIACDKAEFPTTDDATLREHLADVVLPVGLVLRSYPTNTVLKRQLIEWQPFTTPEKTTEVTCRSVPDTLRLELWNAVDCQYTTVFRRQCPAQARMRRHDVADV